MADVTNIASDTITAATALAGLLLVFLGAAVGTFHGIDAEAQTDFRPSYRRKAYLAFSGFILCLASAGFAFVGKLWELPCVTLLAVGVLAAGFVAAAVCAFVSMREI